MLIKQQKLIVFLVLLFAIVSFAYDGSNYLNMRGEKILHPFSDPDDSISAKEIVELRDAAGFPLWFGKNVRKVVCLTGECRIARLWLFWDGTGNYLGFQIPENDSITKNNHEKFTIADYKKLHKILGDSLSILKTITEDDLVDKPDLDAHSGATKSSYREILIDGAAYSCYSLWHTVYGKTRKEVQWIISQKTNVSYLKYLFESNQIHQQRWVINYVSTHPEFQKEFNIPIIKLLNKTDEELAQYTLDYLSPGVLSSAEATQLLLSIFSQSDFNRRFQIIWSLSKLDYVNDDIIFYLLTDFEKNKISASSMHYVFKAIKPANLDNRQIHKKLTKLLKHNNQFVRNRTQKVLSGQL